MKLAGDYFTTVMKSYGVTIKKKKPLHQYFTWYYSETSTKQTPN